MNTPGSLRDKSLSYPPCPVYLHSYFSRFFHDRYLNGKAIPVDGPTRTPQRLGAFCSPETVNKNTLESLATHWVKSCNTDLRVPHRRVNCFTHLGAYYRVS
jgi:hypothetical protein